ncbi:MAG TPA: phospho-sugar mutase, partial [Petrotogaceae bacterium]|nr:phospho-sugar mutase [Petrotogaceae bacterium]
MTDLKVIAYENYKKWLENADLSLKDDLEKIRSNEKEIVECFYKDLEFGTGGMRGRIGVGPNRMNIHTVARASQGFADFLKSQNQNLSVVIAYDTRNKSELFSKVSAEVFAANGLKVFLFSKPTATPILSYAVRYLHAAGGLVITASHNPKEYNGYKVYTSDGTQAVPVYADIITRNVESLDYFKDVKRLDYEELMKSGMIQILDESVFNSYIETVFNYSKGIMGDVDSNLKVVYTPLHGTGLEPVRTLLGRLGFALD